MAKTFNEKFASFIVGTGDAHCEGVVRRVAKVVVSWCERHDFIKYIKGFYAVFLDFTRMRFFVRPVG